MEITSTEEKKRLIEQIINLKDNNQNIDALNLINDVSNLDAFPNILIQKVIILTDSGEFDLALETYKNIKRKDENTKKAYLHLENMIAKRARELTNSKDFDGAFKLLKEFKTKNPALINQMLSILIKSEDIAAVFKFYFSLHNPHKIVSETFYAYRKKLITMIEDNISDKKYGKAIALLEQMKPEKNDFLAAKLLYVYNRTNKLNEALIFYKSIKNKKGRSLNGYGYLITKVQKKINRLYRKGKYEEALELINLIENPSNELLIKKILMCLSLKKHNEARETLLALDGVSYNTLKAKMKYNINQLLEEGEYQKALDSGYLLDDDDYTNYIEGLCENTIHTAEYYLKKLNNDELTSEEIEKSTLTDYEKEILLVAFAEKYGLEYNIERLKYLESSVTNIIISKELINHIKNKPSNYDPEFFESLIGTLDVKLDV